IGATVVSRQLEFLDAPISLHLPALAIMLPVKIDAQVLGDLEEPGLEVPVLIVGAELLVESHEGLLDDVQGVFPVPEDGIDQQKDLLLIENDDVLEGLAIALPGFFAQNPDVLIRRGPTFFHTLTNYYEGISRKVHPQG